MSKTLISYRREDSVGVLGRIDDRLIQTLRLFLRLKTKAVGTTWPYFRRARLDGGVYE